MECYVFIDDSNLWIEGKKARGKKLKDADIDNRYRVDLGKLLNGLVTECRNVSKAILYGSVPPPNDSLWKAAREKNFQVKTFTRSASGGEKEVDTAMASDIVANLHKLYTQDVVFIIVTGDRDLKYPIEMVLENEVPVELWSWEHAMATAFQKLAKANPLFTANFLDSIQDYFGYTAFMSNRGKKNINEAHAIVYKDIPEDEVLTSFASYIHTLMRLFYITKVASQTKGRCDLIVEFPKSKPADVLKLLRRQDYQPCSYPEYKAQLRQQHYQIETKKFVTPLPSTPLDYDSLLDAVESSIGSESSSDEESPVDSRATGDWAAEKSEGSDNYAEEESDVYAAESGYATEGSDYWATEVLRMKPNKKRIEVPCKWGDHCAKGSSCPYFHTEEEKKLFARLPHIQFKFLKTQECNKKQQHITAEQKKWCAYAHNDQDSWCFACKKYGHLKQNCYST